MLKMLESSSVTAEGDIYKNNAITKRILECRIDLKVQSGDRILLI